MTCVSERSGSASRRMVCSVWTAYAQASAVSVSTSMRLRALNSMMRAITGGPPRGRPPAVSAPRPASAARMRDSLSSRKLACTTTSSPASRPPRICALPPERVPTSTSRGVKRPSPRDTKTIRRSPGVEDGVVGDHQGLAAVDGQGHVRVHARPQQAEVVGEDDARGEGARGVVQGRVDVVDGALQDDARVLRQAHLDRRAGGDQAGLGLVEAGLDPHLGRGRRPGTAPCPAPPACPRRPCAR